MTVIQEGGERIHVSAAASAAGNHLVILDWNVVFTVMKSGIWLDDEGEGELGFLE